MRSRKPSAAELAASQAQGNRRYAYAGVTARIREALDRGPATPKELSAMLDVPVPKMRSMVSQLISGAAGGYKRLRAKRDGQPVYAPMAYVEPDAVVPAPAARVEVAPVAAPPQQKFVRHDRDPDRKRCPECGSAQLIATRAGYSCMYCRHRFARADAVTDAERGEPLRARVRSARKKGGGRSTSGSGVIAPPPYRTGYRWGGGWPD